MFLLPDYVSKIVSELKVEEHPIPFALRLEQVLKLVTPASRG
jgi:hypothetical protein